MKTLKYFEIIKGKLKDLVDIGHSLDVMVHHTVIEWTSKLYDWVCILSGLGHLGMNEVKMFFKISDKTLPLSLELTDIF